MRRGGVLRRRHRRHARSSAAAARATTASPPWRGLSIGVRRRAADARRRASISDASSACSTIQRRIFAGVTYTDAHVTLTGHAASSPARSSLGAADRARQRRGRAASSAGSSPSVVPAVVCYVVRRRRSAGTSAASSSSRTSWCASSPYITHNIELTRAGVRRSTASSSGRSPPRPASRRSTPRTIRTTLQNIRLWDWRALQDTLRQIQEIRTYYDFPDIDIDRYEIDGTLRQMMLAVARAERRAAAGEQPQLDQREADLHARLRRHDEPGERLHAGRPAGARAEQHAGAEHDARASR